MQRTFIHRFDRTICDLITCADDDTVGPVLKRRLKALKKKSYLHKNVSYVNVDCQISDNCKDCDVGRLFPKGDSLAYFPKFIRNAMCYKYYWDIDFVNCHPTISLHFAQKHGLKCDNLKEYCENRETILDDLAKTYNYERDNLKETILGMLYGSNFVKSEFGLSSSQYLLDLCQELKNIGLKIYDENPEYAKIKPKDLKLQLSKNGNRNAKSAAYYCQTKERECFCALTDYLDSIKRPICLPMYDGGLIEKIDGETCFPEHLLREAEKHIFEKTGYNIKLVEKKIVNEFDFNKQESENLYYQGYGIKDFDKEHIRIHDKCYRVEQDGKLHVITDSTYFEKYNYMDVKGFKKMIYTMSKRVYDKEDFVPYSSSKCPPRVYNKFKGFKFESLFTEQVDDFDSYKEYLDCLLSKYWNEEIESIWDNSKTKWQITKRLCDNRQDSIDYLINYMAHIIVTPTKKIKKMVILTNTTGGIGKSTLLKMHFCDKLLGNELWTAPQSLEEVFGNRNAVLENKFVLFLDEVDVGVTGKIDGAIKDFVDREYTNIRKMCMDPIQKKCYCNSFLATNKKFGVKFEPLNMRRFAVIEGVNGIDYRLTPEEKKALEKETNDPNFNKIFLLALLNQYNPKFDFDKLPRSELIIEATANAKSDIQQFIEWLFLHMNNYTMEKYVSKYNLPRREYQWWPYNNDDEVGPSDSKTKPKQKTYYDQPIQQIEFRVNFQQLYDMFKYFLSENLPKYEIKSANQFKNNIEWKEFKKNYGINVDSHNVYTCKYMEVRRYLQFPNTMPNQLERAFKKQKTTE
jgi:hypothetical protein